MLAGYSLFVVRCLVFLVLVDVRFLFIYVFLYFSLFRDFIFFFPFLFVVVGGGGCFLYVRWLLVVVGC